MHPLVSILIPCHNASSWIAQTLDSALAQTWPHIEIIVVDDGSRDDSAAIVEHYAPRGIRLVTQSNRGASAARNRALSLSSGDFIQFLDADDLISPQKIGRQLAMLATRPTGALATCRWGRFETSPDSARFVDHDVFRDFLPIDWLLHCTAGARMMHPAAWLIPRAIAEKAGPWDETLSLNDDGEYFARVVLASSGLAFASEQDAASYYRSGLSTSLSQRRSPSAIASLYHSGELVSRHLLATEDSPRVRRALADYWRHLCYELYPDSPSFSKDAEQHSINYGRSTVPPPLGARARLLAHVVGWRLARRLAMRRLR